MQFSPTQAHAGGALTVQADLYLAAIVTAMFLLGCVLVILNRRERSQARKRGNYASRNWEAPASCGDLLIRSCQAAISMGIGTRQAGAKLTFLSRPGPARRAANR